MWPLVASLPPRPGGPPARAQPRRGLSPWPWIVWGAGWTTMLVLDGALDLANLALVLVLSSALATLWLPGWLSGAASLAAVGAFNWTFVPPRHAFSVDLHEHALLLATMLGVNWIISALVVRQRRLADAAQATAARETRLREWADTLREAGDPAAHAAALHAALADETGLPVALHVLQRLDARPEDTDVLHVGEAGRDQQAGLALCMREGRPLGAGSGRHEDQPDLYLPLRGRGVTLGAAVLVGAARQESAAARQAHLQSLCDQMGHALHRALIDREEQRAQAHAQRQDVRNTMLAAIAHDFRTPLAHIMGAASSLHDQAERLDPAQRRRLAAGIVEEAEHLGRLTANTLQLARLGSAGPSPAEPDAAEPALRCDWESAEELIGHALRRARRGHAGTGGPRVRARLEPDLPLLWCDGMLVSQLLDNLVDNALRYSPADAPVELLARRFGQQVVLSVRDRGPGVALAWRERIFEPFTRGEPGAPAAAGGVPPSRPGAGVGLAVCRAIARVHGGELRLRVRGHGGCSFEFHLPIRTAPPQEGPPHR